MATSKAKTLFCPMCGTTMRKAKTKSDAHTRDMRGKLVEVVRVFYACTKSACKSVCWFDYRKDGKEGDLHLFQRLGIKPDGIPISPSSD